LPELDQLTTPQSSKPAFFQKPNPPTTAMFFNADAIAKNEQAKPGIKSPDHSDFRK